MCLWMFRWHKGAMALSGSVWCCWVNNFPGTLLGWPAGVICGLVNVRVFHKISLWLGCRDSPICVFLNVFHICCSKIGKGSMSRAEQVTVAGACQHWRLPCHSENSETDPHLCLQNVAVPQQALLTASEQRSVSSKSSKNCLLSLKPGPLQRELLSN